MGEQNDKNRMWLYLIFGVVVVIAILRFLPFIRFFFVSLIILALAIFVPYFIWRIWQNGQIKKAYDSSIEGQIRNRQNYCKEQINQIKEEIVDIQSSIRQLETQLKESKEITPTSRVETQDIIKSFYAELKLRKAKLDFFETCNQKLEKILQNHLLATEITTQKEKLKRLQEDHYEDLAKMEEFKSDLEMEILYLDTIENLSLRIEKSKSLDHTESLRLELDDMMKDLRDLN